MQGFVIFRSVAKSDIRKLHFSVSKRTPVSPVKPYVLYDITSESHDSVRDRTNYNVIKIINIIILLCTCVCIFVRFN